MRKITLETRGINLSRVTIKPFLCRYGRVDFRTERKMDRSSTRSPVTWQAVASWYIMCNVLKDWEEEKKKPKLDVAKLRYLLVFLLLSCRHIYIYFMLKQGILCSKNRWVLDIITKFFICFQGKSFVLPAQNNYQVFTPLSTTQ